MREIAVSLSGSKFYYRCRSAQRNLVSVQSSWRAALSFVQRGSIRLKRIQKLAEGGAVYPDSHGLAGKQHKNVYLSDVKQTVLEFIRSHATVYDLPMPGASRGRAEVVPVYLPASNTFISIHTDYIKAQGLEWRMA